MALRVDKRIINSLIKVIYNILTVVVFIQNKMLDVKIS